jgi:NADH-quinone oxidoreductase subunit G
LASAHPDYTLIKALAYVIGEATKARVGFLPAAANTVGAYLAGALPHAHPGAKPAQAPGMNTLAMLAEPRKAYLLWGLEPAYDLIDPALASRSLGKAELVIACTAFRSPSLDAAAHVMLPIAGFAETSGTFVNADAAWQGFRGAVAPPGDARPGWKVLRVLGNLLELDGFDYRDSAQVREELRALCEDAKPDNSPRGDLKVEPLATNMTGLFRVGNLPMYSVDPLVRRAPALQRTPATDPFGAYLHPDEAAGLGLAEGDPVQVAQNGTSVRTRVLLDATVPPGCARIPAGVAGSEALGGQIGPVTIEKVSVD